MRLIRLAAAAIAGLAAATGAALAAQPEEWQLGLQDMVSPVGQQVLDFHNLLLVIIVAITLFVLALLVFVMIRFNAKRNPTPSKTTHNTWLEVVWTVVPVLILIIIAVPSFRLLYFMDRVEDPELTVIARGYQWYWGYEYPDQQIPEYSSFMVPDEEIGPDQVRLLSVDEPVVLPVDTDIQILITAGDVLHAWGIPAFAIRRDAVPGRMNDTWVRIEEEGTYYGQCYEICGTGHGFMPIEVRAVSREAFNEWVLQKTAGLDLEEPPVLLAIDSADDDAATSRQVAESSDR